MITRLASLFALSLLFLFLSACSDSPTGPIDGDLYGDGSVVVEVTVDGEPLQGITVRVSPELRSEQETNQNGRTTFQLPPGQYSFTIEGASAAIEFPSRTQTIDVPRGGVVPVRFRGSWPSGVIQGRIVGSQQAVFPDVRIYLTGQTEAGNVSVEGRTDEEGGFRFAGLMRGLYLVTIESADLPLDLYEWEHLSEDVMLLEGAEEEVAFWGWGLWDTPTTPVLELAEKSDGWIRLLWSGEFESAESFRLERRSGDGGWDPHAELEADVREFLDEDLPHSTGFEYRLRACNPGRCSEFSAELTVVTDPPPHPMNLRATQLDTGLVRLTWEAWDGGIDIPTRHQIERRVNGGDWAMVLNSQGGGLAWTDQSSASLASGSSVEYRRRMCGHFAMDGCSEWSNVASVVLR